MKKDQIIKFKDVSYSYLPNSTPILENINFEIFKKEIVCIVGPNGGGKTTLLKLISGILKPDKGKIEIFGSSPGENGEKIGYMPQSVHYDNSFPISVKNVVLMGILGKKNLTSIFGWYSKNDKIKCKKALAKVKMENLIEKPFYALSGGQKQRVLIARALISDPEILVLDEPTANVDYETEDNFISLLKDLNEKKNKTIVMVSHDMGFVSEIVTSVFCINKTLVIHPTNKLSGKTIQETYNSSSIQLIRHDHRCSDKGHIR
ncbi:MAG: metal ABC transporter ATP-binding protein [Desulforegulaceae bacterium]|nr:metal ABC transporter ATP-binding protein [Desulforegulaceae bacterium]